MKEGRPVKVLVRHAESEYNARNRDNPESIRICGYQPKVGLTPKGRVQAELFGYTAPQLLRETLDGEIEVVRFSTSPARRTQQTAVYIQKSMGLKNLYILTDPHLAELRKGRRWLGGHEKRLRRNVETPEYLLRKKVLGWDFRHGNKISGGETPREAGARVLHWLNENPEVEANTSKIAVDMAVGHYMSICYGVGLGLGIKDIEEVDRDYRLPNASAFVLVPRNNDLWEMRSRIILPNKLSSISLNNNLE